MPPDDTLDHLTDDEYAVAIIRERIELGFDSVHFDHLKLTKIPDEIREHPNLRELRIWKCQLAELSESVRAMTKLESLEIRKTQITSLPDWLPELHELRSLSVDDCPLASIPDRLPLLEQLKRLSLDETRIASLPESFSRFRSLESLSLNWNQFTAFPMPICGISSLEELCLSCNRLQTVPEEIAELPRLVYLRLASSSLQDLPASMLKLKRLKYLDLEGNPLLKLPPEFREVEGASVRKTLKYYFTHVVPVLKGRAAWPGGPLPHEDPNPFIKIREAQTTKGRLPTDRLIRLLQRNLVPVCKFTVKEAGPHHIRIVLIVGPENFDAFVDALRSLCPSAMDQPLAEIFAQLQAAQEKEEPLPADLAMFIDEVDLHRPRAKVEIFERWLMLNRELTLEWAPPAAEASDSITPTAS